MQRHHMQPVQNAGTNTQNGERKPGTPFFWKALEHTERAIDFLDSMQKIYPPIDAFYERMMENAAKEGARGDGVEIMGMFRKYVRNTAVSGKKVLEKKRTFLERFGVNEAQVIEAIGVERAFKFA